MMAAILAFIKGLFSKAESDISTLSEQVGNLQQLQFTCKKSGGKLQFTCSNTTGSIWMITTARGTAGAYIGGWMAVCGSQSGGIKELVTAGVNVTLSFDSTTSKLTLTNSGIEDVYVSVIRLYGAGTMTGEQA